MKRSTRLSRLVVLSALTLGVANAAHAQTGPINPPALVNPGPAGGSGPINPLTGGGSGPVAGTQGYTDATLGAYLRGQGYQVQESRLPNGRTLFLATVERNGWRFAVEVNISEDMKTMSVRVQLGSPLAAGRATPEQLLRLMEASLTQVRFGFITYRPADRRLLAFDWFANSPGLLPDRLNAMLDDVVKTYPLWQFAS